MWMYDNNSISSGTFKSAIRKALDYVPEDEMKQTVWGWVEKRDPSFEEDYDKFNFDQIVFTLYKLYNTNKDEILTMREASD